MSYVLETILFIFVLKRKKIKRNLYDMPEHIVFTFAVKKLFLMYDLYTLLDKNQ